MYFQNYGLQKTLLHKFIKMFLEETLPQATWQTVLNTVQMCTTTPFFYFLVSLNENKLEKVSPLLYFFITVKEIELEKGSVSDI